MRRASRAMSSATVGRGRLWDTFVMNAPTSRTASWLPWTLLALVAAVGGAWLARQTFDRTAPPTLESGTWLGEGRDIGDPRLTAAQGLPFGRADFAGHPSVIFFGFTHCPDVCPATLATLARAVDRAELPGLRVYLVSVDPERDTPAALDNYVRAFDEDFIGLGGDLPDIEAFARTLGAARARVDLPGGGYTVDHSATLFLLDRDARLVAVFTPPFALERLASDLATAVSAMPPARAES